MSATLLTAAINADSPLHDWEFKTATPVADNVSSGSVPLTLGNAPTGVQGPLPGDSSTAARQFNGTNQYATASLSFGGATAVTFETWTYWNAFNSTDDDLLFEFFGSFINNSGSIGVVMNNSTEPGTVSFAYNLAGNLSQTRVTFPQSAISAGAWHHLVFAVNSAAWATEAGGVDSVAANQRGMRVYVDGVQVTELTNRANGAVEGTFTGTHDLYLMARGPSSLNGAGRMARATLYATELTASQVLTHYNAGIASNIGNTFTTSGTGILGP